MTKHLLPFSILAALFGCATPSSSPQSPGALLFEAAGGNNAISYGPYRDGQRPGGPHPSEAELREDLHILSQHWSLLRIYGSSELAETMLEIIRDDGLNLQVMLGAWIAAEERRDEAGSVTERDPAAKEANRQEVDAAIRLANQFPRIVTSVCVGNETQVEWSAHRSPLDIHIGYVRQVRAGVDVPVTVADDFNFWNKPVSRKMAAEVDFLTLHAHPLWNGKQIDEALAWLKEQTAAVQALHPDRRVVIGETGWATSVHDEGEQARLIKGKAGEQEQVQFYREVREWATATGRTVFFFEAFDENWKGGSHPAEVEKHWGLFRADRSPKAAMAAAAASR